MYYEGDYPVYHSVHDTYKWLQGLVDPDFSYHMTTTQVAARSLMSTADSIILPLDVRQYEKSLRKSFRGLNDTYGMELRQNNITLDYIDTAIIRWDRVYLVYKHMTLKEMNAATVLIKTKFNIFSLKNLFIFMVKFDGIFVGRNN